MLRRRLNDSKSDESGIVIMTAMLIMGIILLIGGMIFIYAMVSMLVQNIIPIAIAICLVMVLPILAKAYFQMKTKTPYQDQRKVQAA
ncbi:MAG: hypothetical protein IMZ53_08390 [Thermoplasmata archaeon]|nr:hypothetical protein [Thermoplasmata archaeon]MBE3140587.1 hypothetical protein [Thermoplasmata archaeon]